MGAQGARRADCPASRWFLPELSADTSEISSCETLGHPLPLSAKIEARPTLVSTDQDVPPRCGCASAYGKTLPPFGLSTPFSWCIMPPDVRGRRFDPNEGARRR